MAWSPSIACAIDVPVVGQAVSTSNAYPFSHSLFVETVADLAGPLHLVRGTWPGDPL